MNQPPPYAQPPRQPQTSGMPGWLVAFLIAGAMFFVIVPILAVLAIYGVRRYVSNAKTAEARIGVAQLAKDAAAAYEADHKLCRSASAPVPKTVPHGVKYQSAPSEWAADEAANAGFSCLKFQMRVPQYYQYDYRASAISFDAIAHGDVNGDMQESTFKASGQVAGGMLTLAPTLLEVDPEE